MTRLMSLSAAIVMVVATLGIFASPAAAHERRTVGPYTFVVGWVAEPAFAGQLNALDLTVTETAGGKAVEGLESTIKAEVIAGGGSAVRRLTVAKRFGLPGKYQAQFVPTKVGDYTFHLTGTVNAMPIDEKFESGPGRFEGTEDLTPLQFPNSVPSSSDLGSRLDDANTKLTIALTLGVIAVVLSGAALALSRRR